jgi:hypothetical protein
MVYGKVKLVQHGNIEVRKEFLKKVELLRCYTEILEEGEAESPFDSGIYLSNRVIEIDVGMDEFMPLTEKCVKEIKVVEIGTVSPDLPRGKGHRKVA